MSYDATVHSNSVMKFKKKIQLESGRIVTGATKLVRSNYHSFNVNVKIIFKTNEKVQKINILYNKISLIDKLPFHGMYFLPYRDIVMRN